VKGAAEWQKLSRMNVLHLCLHMHDMCSESWYVSGKEIMCEGDFNLDFQALRNAVE
jgi:hypothetical protein